VTLSTPRKEMRTGSRKESLEDSDIELAESVGLEIDIGEEEQLSRSAAPSFEVPESVLKYLQETEPEALAVPMVEGELVAEDEAYRKILGLVLISLSLGCDANCFLDP
jgi:hypothetical protein